MAGMNENKARRCRENEKLARTLSVNAAQTINNQDRDAERCKKNINLLGEMNRLSKTVKELLDAGKTLNEAIEQVISENSNSPALSKERIVDPRESLLGWFYRNYPNYQIRDDGDER